MAWASIMPAAFLKSSRLLSAPRFPILTRSLSFMRLKDSTESSSSRPMAWLPRAIGMFKLAQIDDRSSFISELTSPPPVMAFIMTGMDIFLPRKVTLVSISSRLSSARELCSI